VIRDVILQIGSATLPSVLTIISNPIAIPDNNNSISNDAISVNPPRVQSRSFHAPEFPWFSIPFALLPIVPLALVISPLIRVVVT